MRTIKRSIIMGEERDQGEILGDAFRTLADVARQVAAKEIAVVLPKLDHLDDGYLYCVLDPEVCRQLKKGPVMSSSSGLVLRAFSAATYWKKHPREPHVVLALYIVPDELERIEREQGVQGVVVVPWSPGEYDDWMRTWQPDVIGAPSVPGPAAPLITNPVVERAMKHLTGSINLSTGLSHPLDKSKAVCLFRELVKAGEQYDPALIRAWALRNNWTPSGADALIKIADGTLKGKSFRIVQRGYYQKRYIEKLRQEVAEGKAGIGEDLEES